MFQLGDTDVIKDLRLTPVQLSFMRPLGLMKPWSQPRAVLRDEGEKGDSASALGLGSWVLTDGPCPVVAEPKMKPAEETTDAISAGLWNAFKLPYLNGMFLRPL